MITGNYNIESVCRKIAFFERIPVYPDRLKVSYRETQCLEIDAPLCEEPDRYVSFVDAENKKNYLDSLEKLKHQIEIGGNA